VEHHLADHVLEAVLDLLFDETSGSGMGLATSTLSRIA
jgi:hypothetical protein